MSWTANPPNSFNSFSSFGQEDNHNSTPCVSFIGIVDFSQEARWLYMTDSVIDLLGFEPKELIGRPSLELVHPDEFPRVRQLHYDTITHDKAAVLVYLRLRHKDPYKGYILCGISRTVVHNVLVGSVSFASPGAKALHNASTAQEITVISKGAANFEFRRWHDPSPMPPSPTLPPRNISPPSPPSTSFNWSEKNSPSPPPPAHTQPSHLPTPPSAISLQASSSTSSSSSYQDDREFYGGERSPSPITGRPRPRRHGSSFTAQRQQISDNPPPPGYMKTIPIRHSPPSSRGSQSPPSVTITTTTATSHMRNSGSPSSIRTPPGKSMSVSPSNSPSPPPRLFDGAYLSHESRGRSESASSAEGSYHGYPRRSSISEAQEDTVRMQSSGRRSPSSPQYSPISPTSTASSLTAVSREQDNDQHQPRQREQHKQTSAGPDSGVITFSPLPSKSFRTAFILDRFTLNCTILYCSNDLLVQSTQAIGRSFFDFVTSKDEGIVRSWIECVKGWGVNERGQPSDGGFGFGRFGLLVGGRESGGRLPDPVSPSRGSQRQGGSGGGYQSAKRYHQMRREIREGVNAMNGAYYAAYQRELGEQFPVDAIFSAHSDGLMVILRRANS